LTYDIKSFIIIDYIVFNISKGAFHLKEMQKYTLGKISPDKLPFDLTAGAGTEYIRF